MKLKAGWMAVALLAAGCSSEENAADATVTLAEAIGDAQESDVPLGRELEGPLPVQPRRWEHEGFQCDTTPETTSVDVCGQTLPAELHLAWGDCQLQPMGPGGRGFQPGASAPPPPTNLPPPPVSSGTVDVVTTIEPTAECGEGVPLRFQQQSSHAITHLFANGEARKLTGSISSVFVGGAPGIAPLSRSTTLDTTRARHDSAGTVLDSHHLTGTLEETFDPTAATPTHTSSGTLTATLADGSSSTVTLTDVVRVPPSLCAWPVSGTLRRTTAEGTTHVLAYGPECGQATLDGEAITLPSRSQPHGGPGAGGPGMPPPPPPPDGGR